MPRVDHKHSVPLVKNITVPLVLTIFLVNLSVTVEANPILPTQYQKLIGPGFSTNWFKAAKPEKYSEQNIIDVRAKNFTNLRLRCRADLYSYDYTAPNFTWFLGNLTTTVDHCLKHNVIPIVSWVHHHAEAFASEDDHNAYVRWWTAVAQQLKDKDYKLSFNLFTELGVDECKKTDCSESLRERTDKYNRWTSDVKKAIRDTGGKNDERILILGSPKKTGKGLQQISKSIYENDKYMMAEWHIYASGPNKVQGSKKYWNGDGIPEGRQNVRNAIQQATSFTEDTGLLTYLGAWMPQDLQFGKLTEAEVINFARFFIGELCDVKVPWSLNVLDRYYDTKEARWLTEKQNIEGQSLNMSRVLDNIREVMPKDLKCM